MEPEQIKLLLERTQKLNALRNMRNNRLIAVDIAVNDMVFSNDYSNKDAWLTYRDSLKQITDQYKNHMADESQANALDQLILNTFVWPTKPS